MKMGELVEILIRVHDGADLSPREDEAVCEACNILDKFPRLADVEMVKRELSEVDAFMQSCG